MTTPFLRSGRSRVLLAVVAVVGLAGAAGLAYFFLGGDAPAPPSLGSPAPSSGSNASPTPAGASSPPASEAPSGPSEAPSGAPVGVAGDWTIDTAVGSFSDFSGTWVGFRVDEVLGNGIGSTQAVGRTPGVSGTLTIEGTTLVAVSIEADLTRIVSDRTRRDDAIQRTLETGRFPAAMFELDAPLELGPEAETGGIISVTASGRMTIHGVTRAVTATLEARLVEGRIQVVGTAPFAFAEYDMTAPTAPIVLSVSQTGTLEFQLFFAR